MATLTELATLIRDDVRGRFTAIGASFRTAQLAVGAAPSASLLSRLTTTNGDGKVALRVEQQNTTAAVDAVKIVNSAPAYALKIDHSASNQDAMNISHTGTGAYTTLGLGGSNTTLSTVKITNDAPQTGGSVVFAQGTHAERIGSIFAGDSYGTSGSIFMAHAWDASNATSFRAIYDAGFPHNTPVVWLDANHNDGSLFYLKNSTAQTAGHMVRIIGTAGSTVPVISIVNPGTGNHIDADNFRVSQGGIISASAILNFASFNNARVQILTSGTIIDRNVADASAALRVNQVHASSTGDIAQFLAAGATTSRVLRSGAFATRATTAPTDASLVAGEAAIWFDSTNGAAKLMVKAKQADGTVRTGSVALA